MNKDEKSKGQPQTGAYKKVFDVTRPGKSMASPTSRPIITTHKPQTPDDQFVAKHQGSENDQPTLSKHKKIDLKQPAELSESTAPAPETHDPEPATTAPSIDDAQFEAEAPVDKEMLAQDAPPTAAAPDAAPSPEITPEAEDDKQWTTPPAEAPPEVPVEPKVQAIDSPISTGLNDESAAGPVSAAPHRPMSQDDVLAETGAPMLEHAIVSHHKAHRTKLWEWLLIFVLMLVVAAAALNFLLDAEVLHTNMDIPHTDLLR